MESVKEVYIRGLVLHQLKSRVYFSLGLIVAIALFSVAPQADASHDRLQELLQQKTELQKQIDAKKKEAEAKKKQADTEKKHQTELNAAIRKLEGDIQATEGRISQTERDIGVTQQSIGEQKAKITTKEQEIVKKREDIFETAIEYHIELDQGNELYTVLGSDRISKVIDRTNDLTSLSDKLVIDSENLEKERQELLAAKAVLEQKEQDLTNQKNQLSAYSRALDSQKGQKTSLVAQSKQNQAQFTSQSNEAIKATEQLKKQFAAVANEEAAMRRAASRSSKATAQRGTNPSALGFIWPTNGVITTYFGGRTPFQNFHTGLDIAEAAGAPIVATNSGTITVATKMCCTEYSVGGDGSYGYGNWIEVRHDNGYNSRYAHLMEFAVSPGDRVNRGQVVGYMGGGRGMAGAGWSTGPHLHFEVWDAQGPFDPLDVLP